MSKMVSIGHIHMSMHPVPMLMRVEIIIVQVIY